MRLDRSFYFTVIQFNQYGPNLYSQVRPWLCIYSLCPAGKFMIRYKLYLNIAWSLTYSLCNTSFGNYADRSMKIACDHILRQITLYKISVNSRYWIYVSLNHFLGTWYIQMFKDIYEIGMLFLLPLLVKQCVQNLWSQVWTWFWIYLQDLVGP